MQHSEYNEWVVHELLPYLLIFGYIGQKTQIM
jgi:hypothetical protein